MKINYFIMDEDEAIISLIKPGSTRQYLEATAIEETDYLSDGEIMEQYKQLAPVLKRIFRQRVNFIQTIRNNMGWPQPRVIWFVTN